MHKTTVDTYGTRAQSVCSCGEFVGTVFVGRTASRKAILEARSHLHYEALKYQQSSHTDDED